MNTDIENMQDSLISELSENSPITNDKELRNKDINSLQKHIADYDNILNNYDKHVDKTLEHKRMMKLVFFWLSVFTMFVCIVLIIISVIYLLFGSLLFNSDNKNINISLDLSDYIAPLITSIISFLTVYIIIPKIIAKYLFNSKEDESMRNIISSIQEYDKYVRSSLKKE